MDANQSSDSSLHTPASVPGGPSHVLPQAPTMGTAATPLDPLRPDVNPAVATYDEDDDSEIDQEWVNKAKDIVEQTKDDPFSQSRELNKAKADYLKTRFNKEFKVVQDKA